MDALRRPGTPCSACRKLASNLARLGQLAHHSRRYRFGDRQSGKLASFCGKFANDTQTAGPHQVVMVRGGLLSCTSTSRGPRIFELNKIQVEMPQRAK